MAIRRKVEEKESGGLEDRKTVETLIAQSNRLALKSSRLVAAKYLAVSEALKAL